MVQTFKPKISLVLRKNIGRATVGDDIAASARFRGSNRELDLTPYLGEDGSVTVSKSVRDPAGLFSISLVDKMVADQEESLYGLIESMDVVEIRMARSTADYAGRLPKSMPMIMRGLVTKVARSTVMTASGPRRAVTITGQDYGKILQMMQIKYIPGGVLGQNLLTSFRLTLNYGPGSKPYESAAEFIQAVVADIINPFLATMRSSATETNADYTSPISDLGVEAFAFGGSVFPYGVNEWPGGAIHQLMSYYGDVGPWAEMFIEDREDGPFLIYRPPPFRDLTGAYIQPTGSEPDPIVVIDDGTISIDAERSDEGVANFYWVDAPRYNLVSPALLMAAAQLEGTTGPTAPAQSDYPNCSALLYGLRLMQAQTQQGQRIDGQVESEYEAGESVGIQMVGEKRQVLIASNKDNVVLERGLVRMRGNEKIRPGNYVRLVRGATAEQYAAGGGLAADYYAYQVTQEFSLGGGFLTTVQYDRGTGFIERLKRERGVNSPYLSELSLGGSYA